MMKKFRSFLLLLIVCLLVVGCGKKDDTPSGEGLSVNSVDNVKVETFYSYDEDEVIVKLTNTGKETISNLLVSSDYVDDNKAIEGDQTVVQNLLVNTPKYVSLNLPFDNDFNGYIPDKTNINLSTTDDILKDVTYSPSYFDLVDSTYTMNDNNLAIDVSIINASGTPLGAIDTTVVFFKDGNPIAANLVIGLNVRDTYEETVTLPLLDEYDENNMPKIADYDDVKIYVNGITEQLNEDIDIVEDDIEEEPEIDEGYVEGEEIEYYRPEEMTPEEKAIDDALAADEDLE